MMAGKPTVTLVFAGDEHKLVKSMASVGSAAKGMQEKVGSASDGMVSRSKSAGKSLGDSFRVAKGVLVAQGISAAISGITSFLGGMVREARESEKVSRSTAQGIKTIGAASWTSAKAIGELSQSISNKIGVDDELIQSSANLLLTFRNVRNEAGKGNDIFNRGVRAAQDLAAKGFGSADSAAKMLGKALNDPLKGINALSRAGVTFTDSQKKQIAAMVESGDLLGAQKVIMGELEAQVGGTAAATASAGDKMAVTWANFQEDLGTAVLPMLDSLLGSLTEIITWAQQNPVIVAAIAAITAGVWLLNAALNANPIVLVTTLVAGLVVGLMILWSKSAGFRDFFINAWHGIQNVVGAVVGWIVQRWKDLTSFFQNSKLGQIVSGIFRFIGSAIGAVVGAIGWLINRISDAVGWFNTLIGKANNPALHQGAGMSAAIGAVKRHHTGGVVPGMPGTEQLRILQAGERVTPKGQGGGGGKTIQFAGNTDSAFASAFMKLVRDGVIRVA